MLLLLKECFSIHLASSYKKHFLSTLLAKCVAKKKISSREYLCHSGTVQHEIWAWKLAHKIELGVLAWRGTSWQNWDVHLVLSQEQSIREAGLCKTSLEILGLEGFHFELLDKFNADLQIYILLKCLPASQKSQVTASGSPTKTD